MWNATVIARNARSRAAALEAALASGDAPADAVATARELVVAGHLGALERLFARDDVDGCLAGFAAAAETWQRVIAGSAGRAHLRKSWSMALEGAVVAGRWQLAAALAAQTADDVVPPEYDDEFATAACLEVWCSAAAGAAPDRVRIDALCDRAEDYLGAPHPAFHLFRAAAAGAPDLAERFADWHALHVREVDERLAGASLRPFEAVLVHCWTRGFAVLRCLQRGGLDLAAAGLLTPRRLLPTTLLFALDGGGHG